MWQDILSILGAILQLLSGWQKASEKQEIKQDGKNEHIIEEIKEHRKRVNSAKSILERMRNAKDSSNK